MESCGTKFNVSRFVTICLLVLACSRQPARGENTQFLLEGDVYAEAKIKLSRGSPNTVTHFRVAVSNACWNIQTERAGDVFTIKTEVGSTGTNADIFSVAYIRKNESNQWDKLAATARPGPVPYNLDPMIQVLWYALVSQELYVKDGRQSSPHVFVRYHPTLNDAQFSVIVDVKHEPAPPYFLSSAAMFEDGIWRFWEEENDAWVHPPLEKPLPHPYEEGYTNCVYAVKEFGETGGMKWPVKFSFVQYQMKNGATNAADLGLTTVMEGKVTRFDAEPQLDSYIPEVPQGMIVNDERFIWDKSPVYSFTYPATGKWLSRDATTNTVAYKKQVKEQTRLIPLQKARLKTHGVPTLILPGGSLLAP